MPGGLDTGAGGEAVMNKPVTVGAYSRRFQSLENDRVGRILVHTKVVAAEGADRTRELRQEARKRRQ